MAGATEKELAALHARLAKAFSTQLEQSEHAELLLEEYGDVVPDAIKDFLEKASLVSPALLTAAARFLKDNDITCVVEESKEASALEQLLSEKRKRVRKEVGNVSYLQPED